MNCENPGKQYLKVAAALGVLALAALFLAQELFAQEGVEPFGAPWSYIETAMEIDPTLVGRALATYEADAPSSNTATVRRAARGILAKRPHPRRKSQTNQYVRGLFEDIDGAPAAWMTPAEKAGVVNAIIDESETVIAARIVALQAAQKPTVNASDF